MTDNIKFENYKITCYSCNKDSDNNRFDKTTDNKDVCLRCLGEAQDHYKKGLLSSDEINQYLKFKEFYKQKQNELSLQLRKYGMFYNKDPVEYLKEVIKLRQSLSETSFKKGQGFGQKSHVNTLNELNGALTITMEEHIILIDQILKNFDLIEKKIPLAKYKKIVISRGASQNKFVTAWERTFVIHHNITK